MSAKQARPWDEQDEQPVSRSQRKRDSLALQKLGEELTRLSPSAQASLPISEEFRAALAEYRRLSSHESKRRQLQYIGRLMREEESPEAVEDAVEALRRGFSPAGGTE